MLDIHSGLI